MHELYWEPNVWKVRAYDWFSSGSFILNEFILNAISWTVGSVLVDGMDFVVTFRAYDCRASCLDNASVVNGVMPLVFGGWGSRNEIYYVEIVWILITEELYMYT